MRLPELLRRPAPAQPASLGWLAGLKARFARRQGGDLPTPGLGARLRAWTAGARLAGARAARLEPVPAPAGPGLGASLAARLPDREALRAALEPGLRSLRPSRERPRRPSRGARLRARFLLSFLLIPFLALAYRLHQVQVVQHEEWAGRARAQHVRVRPIEPERGRLLMRDGERLVPAAISLRRGSLLIEGRQDRDAERFLQRLRGALEDLTPAEEAELRAGLGQRRGFYLRRRGLDQVAMERLEQARLPHTHLDVEHIRSYPFGALAAQVLGLVDAEQKGGTGLEARADRWLSGTPGEREVRLDRRHRELVGLDERVVPAVPGADVVLTIDRSLQRVVEEELARTAEEHQPEGAAAVVIDPQTGDILAMGSWPTYDPSAPGQDYVAGQHMRAIQHGYEPGSTMKPLLVGTAWQLGLGGPERMLDCPLRLKVPGRPKPIVDSHHVGLVPELEVLVQSSNTGAFQIASRLSFDQVRRAIAEFGLGRRTGIPLPAEIAGDTRSLGKLSTAHLAAVAQGYAVMVTPLQMALAYGALANGGTLLRPRLVMEVRSREGEVLAQNEPRAAARPLDAAVTRGPLREAMTLVVNGPHGTAKRAASKSYTIAGKTGTTKKLTADGHYHEREVVASFCGYAPAEAPRLAFSVVVWAPSTKDRRAWGGTVAGPCAGRIVDRALRLLRVPPKPPEEAVAARPK
ncbi:MAG: peptidoglycan D,D-transpeptidase FtsI family protein [Planctomycetota bacterium]